MNLAKYQEAMAFATPIGHSIAVDTTPAFVVQYVPSSGTGGSAATIALIQDGAMTFLVDAEAPAGADAIGTAGVITTSDAGYDTIGELVDYINSCPAWRAYICAALRSNGCEALLAKSATSCIGDTGLTFYWDNTAAERHGVCISGERFINNSVNGWIKDEDDKCLNFLMSLSVQHDMASAGHLVITSASQSSDGTQLWAAALADDTLTEHGYDQPNSVWLQATLGQRLVILADHDTDIGATVTKADFLGKTAVLSGKHIITGVNY